MGKDYVIEFTPPTAGEIKNARPLATVLPHDALTHAVRLQRPCVRAQKMIALCRKAGATIASERFAIVYVMNKTGRIVTEANLEFLTDSELLEWNDAVNEYRQKIETGEIQ